MAPPVENFLVDEVVAPKLQLLQLRRVTRKRGQNGGRSPARAKKETALRLGHNAGNTQAPQLRKKLRGRGSYPITLLMFVIVLVGVVKIVV
jgi:hypothetical protein